MDLTHGSIASISGGATDLKPVVQVVDVRLVNTAQSKSDRYRMMLSDGVHQQQAMLATQMNGLVSGGDLQKGSVVRLNEFICNVIQNRRIIIVINLDVLVDKHDLIGDPVTYDSASAPLQARAPTGASPSAVDHGRANTGPPQPYGSLHTDAMTSGSNMMGGISVNAKTEPASNNTSYGTTHTAGSMSGRNINNVNYTADVRPNAGIHNQRLSGTSGGGYRPPGNTYGRPGQQTYQPPPSVYSNRGPIAKNEAPARIIPIAALNPYQGRWTIKARVTSKGELRRYNNPRGEGKVFSFDLLDSEGGEIRVTCFNFVADQFYDQLEAGKVYLISKGTLKPAQKNFNHLNNEYEIFLESTSTIQPCLEEDNIPRQIFNFRPINEIEGMENNTMVDLIGIVSSISTASSIMRKNGTETAKRILQLKDMSGRSVEITLWGNFCGGEGQQLQDMCDSGVFPVLAIKAGRVNDFSGKSVGTISTSQLFINPDFPEAHKLSEWFSREGKTVVAPSISKDSSMGKTDVRKTVSQIKDEGLGRSEKPDWITIKATIAFIKSDSFCYTACPLMVGERQCMKKVTNIGDGSWHCDRCDRSFPECDYRYLLQFQIQDHSGMTWVTAFQEAGEELMGISAKELYLLKHEEQDDLKFAEVIRKVLFNQYLFKLKVKEEAFNDEQRVKSTVIKAEKVNPSSESRFLLGLITKLSVEPSSGAPPMQAGMANAAYNNMPVAQTFVNNSISSAGVDSTNYSGMNRYRADSTNYSGMNSSGYGGAMGSSGINSSGYGGAMGSSGMNSSGYGGAMGSSGMNSSGYGGAMGNGSIKKEVPQYMNRQQGQFAGDTTNRYSNAPGGGGNLACYKCQQPGHFARDCPNGQRRM